MRSYDPAMASDRRREIARRTLVGQKRKQIARELDVTTQTVSNARHHPETKTQMEILHRERDIGVAYLQEQLSAIAPKAVQVLEGILDDGAERSSLRASVAQDLLDRAGLGVVHKSLNLQKTITSEELAEIKQRAMQSGRVVNGCSY